ncbi:MAG: hypothetical protein KC680_00720 [Candidatus Peregrinibacteria bacterium]|nr:hypothetical protein [Candidatus Peregrinibacteria bacterium]MCB9807748.1 hypothetical protein [Candidatus Peribacteria bacterium]
MHRILRYLIFGVLILGGVVGTYHLLAQAWYFFNGAHSGDAKYYWTVGQAIRNGFTLYTDTFDTKPPTIYLLSALPHVIGNSVNSLMTLTLPAIFGYTAWTMTRKKLQASIGLLFGLCVTLNMGFQAQAWQVEWYGGFFGILYVSLLALYPEKMSRGHIAALTALLTMTVAWKEPFVLSLLAAAIILLQEKKQLSKQFLIPLSVTAIIGITALALFGYLGGYIDTYLPAQFGHHIARSMPMYLRSIQVGVLGYYLSQFSIIFIGVIVVLILSVALIRMKTQKWWAIALSILALLLVTLAGNLRGYPASNHFVVAVPYYAALFYVWLKYAKGFSAIGIPVLIACTLITLSSDTGFSAYAMRLKEEEVSRKINTSDAQMMDAVLDACNIDRYFFVEERPYMEYMHHSPLNFFVYVGPEAIVYHSPILIEKQLDSFSKAKIVIAQGDAYELRERPEEKALTEMTFRYLANNFTITPWECAADLPMPENYSLLFRNDPENMKPFPYTMR